MTPAPAPPDSDPNLRRCIDRMVEAARRAAVVSSLWLVGLLYQLFSSGATFAATFAKPLFEEAMPEASPFADVELLGRLLLRPGLLPVDRLPEKLGSVGLWLVLPLLVPIFFRLVAGLATLGPSAHWKEARGVRRAPSLRLAWERGAGLGRSACGLWIQIILMMFAASLLFIGPTKLFFDLFELDGSGPLGVLATGLCISLIVFYGFVLTVLFQIALHSLVQNRRGVGSALLHAWRIAKNDPMSTVRATLVDALLFAAVSLIPLTYSSALNLFQHRLPAPLMGVLLLPVLMIGAWSGCARCYYWAHCYQALGGLSTRENAPGA